MKLVNPHVYCKGPPILNQQITRKIVPSAWVMKGLIMRLEIRCSYIPALHQALESGNKGDQMKGPGIIMTASSDFPRGELIYGHKQREKARRYCNITLEYLTDSKAVTQCQKKRPIIPFLLGKRVMPKYKRGIQNSHLKLNSWEVWFNNAQNSISQR